MQIDIFDSMELLTAAAGELFIELGHEAITERGRFDVLLSGGNTPRAVYQWLAEHGDQLDWTKVRLFFGDERCVPPEHTDSNYRMVRETLLDPLKIMGATAYRIAGEFPPDEAAERYESTVRGLFDDLPRFDLIYLGLGADAHTASLFPGTRAIHESERWFVANYAESMQSWRITATPPVINNARLVAFLVTGESKAEALNFVINGEKLINLYPAQIVAPSDGDVRWLVDKAAAKRLSKR